MSFLGAVFTAHESKPPEFYPGGSLFPTKCALFLFCGLFPDDCFLQCVPRLKANPLARWNLDLGFRRWIRTCPGGCLTHFKCAEACQGYLIPALEGFGDSLNNSVYGLGALRLRKPCFLCHCRYEI